jgi:hypothetical protein
VPILSITRLRLRSWRYFPLFVVYTMASSRQARRTPGFLSGWMGSSSATTFWTATVWRDDASLRAFRDQSWHLVAMRKLLDWCDEAAVARMQQGDDQLPDAPAAFRRLVSEGRLSKVRHPSPAHAAGQLAGDGRVPRPGPRLRPAAR